MPGTRRSMSLYKPIFYNLGLCSGYDLADNGGILKHYNQAEISSGRNTSYACALFQLIIHGPAPLRLFGKDCGAEGHSIQTKNPGPGISPFTPQPTGTQNIEVGSSW